MKRLAVVLLCGVLMGCKGPRGEQGYTGNIGATGPKGDAGSTGSAGQDGDDAEVYSWEKNGTIESDGSWTITPGINLETHYLYNIYYATSGSDLYIGLSNTQVSGARSYDIDFGNERVHLYNMRAGDKYKIVIGLTTRLNVPRPSGQFGDRLLW